MGIERSGIGRVPLENPFAALLRFSPNLGMIDRNASIILSTDATARLGWYCDRINADIYVDALTSKTASSC